MRPRGSLPRPYVKFSGSLRSWAMRDSGVRAFLLRRADMVDGAKGRAGVGGVGQKRSLGPALALLGGAGARMDRDPEDFFLAPKK